MQDYKTSEVYGISRDLPLNYVTRHTVDSQFEENIAREKHIVVYGSSKQGKTSLRKKHLTKSQYVLVQCSNKLNLASLHMAILKAVGYSTVDSVKKETQAGVTATIGASGDLFFIKSTGELEGEITYANETELKPIAIDFTDVNDIIKALKAAKAPRLIVLEDFHYLPEDTQKDFAVALKAFHEASSYIFIVVGVWLDENRLTVYNGDLSGRVISVNADKWTDVELRKVITDGEQLLNIVFEESFINDLIRFSYGSVYFVQDACYRACIASNITHRQPSLTRLGNGVDVEKLVKIIVNESGGRYLGFLEQFSTGFQETTLEMYKWLLYAILTADEPSLEKGLTLRQVTDAIQSKHEQGKELNQGNITQALLSTANLQVKKEIKPLILDYDGTNRSLRIVDKGFLIWLGYQNKNELLGNLGLPYVDPI